MSNLSTWVSVPANSDFSIHNLPFGIFSAGRKKTRVGVAIGTQILDLYALAELGHFDGIGVAKKIFDNDYLNDFMALGKPVTKAVRERVQQLLSDENSPLKNAAGIFEKQSEATMHLPVKVRDYTDFYSSIEHATNVGKMFRDPENALLPNWKHLPVGYHGRASSIVVSGTDIRRPKGQIVPKGETQPIHAPCRLLDFELEMAFLISKPTSLGDTVSTADAEDHIFGFVLFNDWSARDIQKWEYIPLGPFLGKSFASSISPWVVTLEALEPFRVEGYKQDPPVLPYLQYEGFKNIDIHLEVAIEPEGVPEKTVCRSNYKYMYWNMVQQLAHHTVNGCNLNTGDMMASGTISGKDESAFGSMLELSWAGTKKLTMNDGSTRVFLQDNDTVIMRGHAEKNGIRVGFGEVRGKVVK
ncbi:MAG TPA: fumarylacetoacetase [Bacteroidetes bacterium]|nr:fumarylacetoacetase [Bacteroidota bacterium]